MTTLRKFEFNPLLYRVCNMRTWERLEQMDGMTVEVSGPPFRHVVYETYNEPMYDNCNVVRADFPDGHGMTLLVFNSELSPVDEPAEGSPPSVESTAAS